MGVNHSFIPYAFIHSFELARGILTPNEMGGEMEGFENIYVLLLSSNAHLVSISKSLDAVISTLQVIHDFSFY
jgi:hypothetical protein